MELPPMRTGLQLVYPQEPTQQQPRRQIIFNGVCNFPNQMESRRRQREELQKREEEMAERIRAAEEKRLKKEALEREAQRRRCIHEENCVCQGTLKGPKMLGKVVPKGKGTIPYSSLKKWERRYYFEYGYYFGHEFGPRATLQFYMTFDFFFSLAYYAFMEHLLDRSYHPITMFCWINVFIIMFTTLSVKFNIRGPVIAYMMNKVFRIIIGAVCAAIYIHMYHMFEHNPARFKSQMESWVKTVNPLDLDRQLDVVTWGLLIPAALIIVDARCLYVGNVFRRWLNHYGFEFDKPCNCRACHAYRRVMGWLERTWGMEPPEEEPHEVRVQELREMNPRELVPREERRRREAAPEAAALIADPDPSPTRRPVAVTESLTRSRDTREVVKCAQPSCRGAPSPQPVPVPPAPVVEKVVTPPSTVKFVPHTSCRMPPEFETPYEPPKEPGLIVPLLPQPSNDTRDPPIPFSACPLSFPEAQVPIVEIRTKIHETLRSVQPASTTETRPTNLHQGPSSSTAPAPVHPLPTPPSSSESSPVSAVEVHPLPSDSLCDSPVHSPLTQSDPSTATVVSPVPATQSTDSPLTPVSPEPSPPPAKPSESSEVSFYPSPRELSFTPTCFYSYLIPQPSSSPEPSLT